MRHRVETYEALSITRPFIRSFMPFAGCLAVIGLTIFTATAFSTAGASAAERGAKLQPQLLRGTVLPRKKLLKDPDASKVKLASLIKKGTHSDVTTRLDYSSFRFGFKPPSARAKKKRVRVASLAPVHIPGIKRRKRRSRLSRKYTRGLIKWLAYPGCLPRSLKKVLAKLAHRYGNLTVSSTHRSRRHNREVGGAPHSYHLSCQAVDFRISRNFQAAKAFLRRQAAVGGLKHYGGGRFHIDIGPRRTW